MIRANTDERPRGPTGVGALITRRSQVQILSPPPSKEPAQRPFPNRREGLLTFRKTGFVQQPYNECTSGWNPKVRPARAERVLRGRVLASSSVAEGQWHRQLLRHVVKRCRAAEETQDVRTRSTSPWSSDRSPQRHAPACSRSPAARAAAAPYRWSRCDRCFGEARATNQTRPFPTWMAQSRWCHHGAARCGSCGGERRDAAWSADHDAAGRPQRVVSAPRSCHRRLELVVVRLDGS